MNRVDAPLAGVDIGKLGKFLCSGVKYIVLEAKLGGKHAHVPQGLRMDVICILAFFSRIQRVVLLDIVR